MNVAEFVDAGRLSQRISVRTAAGISSAIIDLIRDGELVRGTRLPTVRALATALGVSPSTVAEAWRVLARYSMVHGNRRSGTLVSGPPQVQRPARYEMLGAFGDRLRVDLTVAAPDPALLPDLHEALRFGAETANLNSYDRESITDPLRRAIEPTWPFPAEAWMAVNGGYEGVQLLIAACSVAGDRIAIENPTSARLFDLIEQRTDRVITAACDAEGPEPDAVARALAEKPALFIFQPRAHTPCGHGLSVERARELARLFAGTSTLVVEDDGIGDLSNRPPISVGTHLPQQTVCVRSLSKSYGPDLRLAVIGGPTDVLDRVRIVRSYGAGWTSRILQNAAAHLMEDPAAVASVAAARAEYAARRNSLRAALASRGIRAENEDGLVLWVPVRDESATLVTLAAHGVSVGPGSRYTERPEHPHVRVAISRIDRSPAAIADTADLWALAARAG